MVVMIASRGLLRDEPVLLRVFSTVMALAARVVR
jgi:hypothetical protein